MASITRSADAVWQGGGKDGSGRLTTASGALRELSYSAGMRFGEDPGTNPEELIAAAHAGCFTMALAFALSGAGHTPQELSTKAKLTIERENSRWRIVRVALELTGRVPGLSEEAFREAAEGAKAGCPVSRALNAEITLKAELA